VLDFNVVTVRIRMRLGAARFRPA